MAAQLEVGMTLQAKYSDGEFYAAEVVAISNARRRAAAPVKVHFKGYGEEDDAWVATEDIKSKGAKSKAKAASKETKAEAPKEVDYSKLTEGMKVQAEWEGKWYSAEVITVSKAQRRAKVPVKVRFVGYGEGDDQWLGADRLKSKMLKAAPVEAKKPEKPEKSEKSQKSVKSEKPEKSEKSEKPKAKAKPKEKSEKPKEKSEKTTEKSEKPAKPEKAEKAEKPAKAEKPKAKAKSKEPVRKERVYSIADQVVRFGKAKEDNNERYLDISTVYDGSSFKGKRVVLVGASKGLGLCIVKELVAVGADTIATCRKVTPELEAVGVKQVITDVEVTDVESMKKMASQVTGPLDYIIYNAGYFPDIVDNLGSVQDAEAIKQIDICALGPMRCVAAFKAADLLKGAKVVIITSQAGSVQWRFTQNKEKGGDYGHHMSRAACNIGGALMSEELRSAEVPVVLLHPGFNRTGMTSKYSHIWDIEGAVEPEVGAKRVLHEASVASMATTGRFINCEDGRRIPW